MRRLWRQHDAAYAIIDVGSRVGPRGIRPIGYRRLSRVGIRLGRQSQARQEDRGGIDVEWIFNGSFRAALPEAHGNVLGGGEPVFEGSPGDRGPRISSSGERAVRFRT